MNGTCSRADSKYINIQLRTLHNCVLYRKTQRVVFGLPPDPPFIPTAHLPKDDLSFSERPSPAEHASSVDRQFPFPVQADDPPPVIQLPQTTRPAVPEAPQRNPQPFSDSGPIEGMALKLKRSESRSTFGSTLFVLDARMEMSAQKLALISKYKLGNRIVYESAARQARADATRRHLSNSRDGTSLFDSPGRQALGIGKTFFNLGRAAISAAAAASSLRITVNGLIAGVHVECKDMDELLEAEEAITDAARNLKAELAAATSFTGQEQVIDL